MSKNNIKKYDGKSIIWRYMDFTKFIYLLETKALFFSRSDKFDDKFEGSYTINNIQYREKLYSNLDHDKLEELSIVNEKIKE